MSASGHPGPIQQTHPWIVQYCSMSDYQLNTLGTREFEHMIQALAIEVVGPIVSVFGDGPDGGREATWDGEVPPLSGSASWSGYGVLQAKFQGHTSTPAENLKWFKSQTRAELKQWAAKGTKRFRKPEYFLLATNSRLSPAPEHGKDEAVRFVRDEIKRLNLPVRAFRIWDYDDLRGLLDTAHDVRKRYAAFLTSGDVIAYILDKSKTVEANLGKALATASALSLADDAPLNLTQTGVMNENTTTISDVFVDLPFATGAIFDYASKRDLAQDISDIEFLPDDEYFSGDDEIENDFDLDVDQGDDVAAQLIRILNTTRDPRSDIGVESSSVVLVGGPGQGKSTVTQWLSQLYRVAFLADNPALRINQTIAAISDGCRSRAEHLQMPQISARRWPFRVILTELADYLADNTNHSLVDFIASRISARGTASVTSMDVISWLERYPAVLFIDGLDEVPPSSNREAVLKAISDLTIEIDTRRGDLVVVATTRPQGYSGELGRFKHINLVRLNTPQAIECASALIDVRFGVGTLKAGQVLDRLRKASTESSTQNLFESPLQVTILTVLLEKLGKAPGDRSRLFSAYYDVISSREQEKSGDLSDLLQRYEADIRALHRNIGFELQRRAGEAGGTSSTLPRSEFFEVIGQQFRDQGHSEVEIEKLRQEFARLVTDRLVFLTYVTGDRVGFEIRSLQEFMAGEYLVSLPENQILREIDAIATSAYWRNTVLFAVGSIFAHREHLRAEVTLLCQKLDSDYPTTSSLPGARLAVDILRDGSCLSMPRYAQRLATSAAGGIGGPVDSHFMHALADLNDARVQDVIRSIASSIEPAPSSVWINRAMFWSASNRMGPAVDLQNILSSADPESLQRIIKFAWIKSDISILNAAQNFIGACDPSTFTLRSESGLPSSSSATTFKHLRILSDDEIDDAQVEAEAKATLWGRYRRVNSDQEAWRWLRDESPDSDCWKQARSLACFALDPSASTLSQALRDIADTDAPYLPARTPWVVLACLRQSNLELGDAPASFALRKRAIHSVAADALQGVFGDTGDWLDWESSLPQRAPLEPRAFEHWMHVDGDSLPLAALNFIHNSSPRRSIPKISLETLRAIVDLSENGPSPITRARARGLGLFLFSVLIESIEPGEESSAELDTFFPWARRAVTDYPYEGVWWSWIISAMEKSVPIGKEVLLAVGRAPWLIRRGTTDFAMLLLDEYRSDPQAWPLLRLALIGDPALVLRLTAAEAQPTGDEEDPVYRRLVSMIVFARGAVLDMRTDLTLQLKGGPHNDTLGVDWLTELARSNSVSSEGAAFICANLSRIAPEAAEAVVHITDAKLKDRNPELATRLNHRQK